MATLGPRSRTLSGRHRRAIAASTPDCAATLEHDVRATTSLSPGGTDPHPTNVPSVGGSALQRLVGLGWSGIVESVGSVTDSNPGSGVCCCRYHPDQGLAWRTHEGSPSRLSAYRGQVSNDSGRWPQRVLSPSSAVPSRTLRDTMAGRYVGLGSKNVRHAARDPVPGVTEGPAA